MIVWLRVMQVDLKIVWWIDCKHSRQRNYLNLMGFNHRESTTEHIETKWLSELVGASSFGAKVPGEELREAHYSICRSWLSKCKSVYNSHSILWRSSSFACVQTCKTLSLYSSMLLNLKLNFVHNKFFGKSVWWPSPIDVCYSISESIHGNAISFRIYVVTNSWKLEDMALLLAPVRQRSFRPMC